MNCIIFLLFRSFVGRRKDVLCTVYIGTSGGRRVVHDNHIIIVWCKGATSANSQCNTACTLFEKSRGLDMVIIILQRGWRTCEKTSSAYPHRACIPATEFGWIYIHLYTPPKSSCAIFLHVSTRRFFFYFHLVLRRSVFVKECLQQFAIILLLYCCFRRTSIYTSALKCPRNRSPHPLPLLVRRVNECLYTTTFKRFVGIIPTYY